MFFSCAILRYLEVCYNGSELVVLGLWVGVWSNDGKLPWTHTWTVDVVSCCCRFSVDSFEFYRQSRTVSCANLHLCAFIHYHHRAWSYEHGMPSLTHVQERK